MSDPRRSARTRLIDIVGTIKQALDLPKGLDVRFVSDETGQPVPRHRKVEPRDLATIADRVSGQTRVARLCDEIERICGAQVNVHVELFLAGQPIDGHLSVARLH